MLREFEDKENILADMDEQVGRLCRRDGLWNRKADLNRLITSMVRTYIAHIALWPNGKYTVALFLLFLDVLSTEDSTCNLDNKEVL